MPQRAIKTSAPRNPPQRFQMQIPHDELEQLELTAARMRRRRDNRLSNLTKDPSAAKIVRVALRQLLGAMTTEQLEDLIETTEL